MPGLHRARGGLADAAPALHHRVPVRDQPRVIDVVDREPERRAVALDRDFAALDTPQDTAEVAALAARRGERHRELDLGLAANEVREVRRGAQRAIDARRADLEVECLRDRILDVEHGRQLARQVLAVEQVDAVGRNLVGIAVLVERPIDRHAQRPAALLEHEAQLDQLVASRLAHRLDDRDQTLLEWIARHAEGKWWPEGNQKEPEGKVMAKSEKKGGQGGHLYRGAIEAVG